MGWRKWTTRSIWPQMGLCLGLLLRNEDPVAGVSISCSACKNNPSYYPDDDDADGLFTTEATLNAETGPSGVWLVPAGPVANYRAMDTAKELTFPDLLTGSDKGRAVITSFVAEEATSAR